MKQSGFLKYEWEIPVAIKMLPKRHREKVLQRQSCRYDRKNERGETEDGESGPHRALTRPPRLTYDETLVQAPEHVPQHDEFAELLAHRELGEHPAEEGQFAIVGVLVLPLPADRQRADLRQEGGSGARAQGSAEVPHSHSRGSRRHVCNLDSVTALHVLSQAYVDYL